MISSHSLGIFQTASYSLAVGAGWIILAIVDILWMLYFTSSDDAWFTALFDIGSRVHFSSRTSSGGAGFPGSASASRRAGSASGHGAATTMGMTGAGGAGVSYASYHNLGGGPSKGPGSAASHHLGGPATISVQDLHEGTSAIGQSDAVSSVGTASVSLKARALYSCTCFAPIEA